VSLQKLWQSIPDHGSVLLEMKISIAFLAGIGPNYKKLTNQSLATVAGFETSHVS
jgi:hypothetical protein